MRNRGFTLIELLAVIVILSIIALIATPIIMNTISNSKKSAAERSAQNYVKAVETMMGTERLDQERLKDGNYIVSSGKIINSITKKEYTIEMSGQAPIGGIINIDDNSVVKDSTSSMVVGEYIVSYDSNSKIVATLASKATLCQAIEPFAQPIFDTDISETAPVVVGVKATTTNPFALGAVYSCNLGDIDRTFYVIEEGTSYVKLLMDENMVNDGYTSVSWQESSAYLQNLTSNWSKLKAAGGTVELPSGQLIANASSVTGWTSDKDDGYAIPDWMRTNLDYMNSVYGYWTSTPYMDGSTKAWFVSALGDFWSENVTYGTGNVRPVIKVAKTNF